MTNMFKLLSGAAKATIPGEHIDMMWSTLVTGLVVVFLILALLVFFLWLMGKIMTIKRKPKDSPKTEEVKTASPEPAPQTEAISEIAEYEDDDEIIAVISAAIAAYGESEGKQYRIASVKRKEKALRSNWSAAGISENTRPF